MGTNFAKGKDALKQGDKQQAMQWFKQAIAEDPKNPAIWVELSYTIDDIEKQKECLKHALKISPSYHPAQAALNRLNTIQEPVPAPSPLPEWFEQPPAASVGEASSSADDPFALAGSFTSQAAATPKQHAVSRRVSPNQENQQAAGNIPTWIWAIVGVAGLTLVVGLISFLFTYTSDGSNEFFTYTISNLVGSILYAVLFLIAAYLTYKAVLHLKNFWQALDNPLVSVLIFISITKLTTDAFYRPLSNFIAYGDSNFLGFGMQCLEGLVVIGAILAGSFYITRNTSKMKK